MLVSVCPQLGAPTLSEVRKGRRNARVDWFWDEADKHGDACEGVTTTTEAQQQQQYRNNPLTSTRAQRLEPKPNHVTKV
eukprot:3266510-Amphidinium_carterae.1